MPPPPGDKPFGFNTVSRTSTASPLSAPAGGTVQVEFTAAGANLFVAPAGSSR